MQFLSETDLIDLDLSMREAVLAFVWTRLRVVDEQAKASKTKMNNLRCLLSPDSPDCTRPPFPAFHTASLISPSRLPQSQPRGLLRGSHARGLDEGAAD